MKSLSQFHKIYLYADKIDFRKSIDGLSQVVEAAHRCSAFEHGSLFVFTSKNRTRMKILYWDTTGFALWYKRLEKERFPWPKKGATSISIATKDLELLLSGIDIFKIKPHQELRYARTR